MDIRSSKEYRDVLERHGVEFAAEWLDRMIVNQMSLFYIRRCDVDVTLVDVVSDTDNWSFVSFRTIAEAEAFCLKYNLIYRVEC